MAKKANKKSSSKRQPARSRLSTSHAKKEVAELVLEQAISGVDKQAAAPKRPAPKHRRNKQLVLPIGLRRQLIITIKHTKKPKKRPAKKSPARTQAAPRRKRSVLSAALFIIMGLAGLGYFGWNTIWAPAPSNAFSPPLPTIQQPVTAPVSPTVVALPRSEPVRVHIPAVGINTSLISVGKNQDNTMEVPVQADIAAWYRHSPTPGELGPSIIVGHVDSPKGPAVFWRLRELKPGDIIEVNRADSSVAKFKVDSVKQFEQDKFPTKEVYGNITYAGLRLITCGGSFNRLTRSYSHNTVIYATLTP